MGYYSGTLQKGSQGEETKKWQNFLKSQGYDLEVDGIFGDITTKFTKDYQQKNGLAVDGIVGKDTWGKAGFSNINTPVSAPTIEQAPPKVVYDSTSYDDTEKGKETLGAYNDAKDAVANYGDFKYGNQEQYKAILDSILNREKFSYDLNGDALYQQYKDKYIKQGKMAMGDAIGQASAMTGGYGNSYAQSVGQQAYQAQLENLNDIVPELYQMALDKYNMEGQELLNQYGVLTDDYDRAYGKHQDGYNKLLDALGIAKSDYYDGANMFYTEQDNKNTVAGREFDDAMAIYNANNENAWKQAEWNESNRRFEVKEDWMEKEYNAKYGNTTPNNTTNNTTNNTPNNNSNNTPNNNSSYDNGSLSASQIKELQNALGVEADGYYGSNSQKAAGGLSAEEAYKKFVVNKYTYEESPAVSEFVITIRTRSEFGRAGNPDKEKYGDYKSYVKAMLEKFQDKLTDDDIATIAQKYGL